MRPAHVRFLRRALVGLILLILGAVAANYLDTWRRRGRLMGQAAAILSPEMIRSAEGVEYSENQKGIVRFRLRARRLTETRAGVSYLEGIEAFDTSPDGSRRNTIRSRQAEYDRDHRRALFRGDVRVAMSGGVELRTESLRYDLDAGVGTSDERVEMSSPEVRGTARGVRYERASETLDFHEALDFQLARAVRRSDGTETSETVRARAARGSYSRAAALLRLEGGARLESAASELEGERIEATFAPDGKRLNGLVCHDRARYRSTDPDQARTLEGERLRFRVSAETGALERIDVDGNGKFTGESPEGRDELRGARIRVDLDPDRGFPTLLESAARSEFRRSGKTSEAVMTGERLRATFVAGTGQPERFEIREHARLRSRAAASPTGAGTSDELAAEEITMSFRPAEGQRTVPARLRAERAVEWRTTPASNAAAAKSAEPPKSLRADSLEMTYAASGEVLDSGVAAGHVVLSGIAAGDAARSEIRRLECERARFSFHPTSGRLRDFDAERDVNVLFRKPADPEAGRPAQESRTSSTALRATLRESDGSLATFGQWGSFVYAEEGRTARAGRADYAAEAERLILTESPEASDASATTTGERMEYDRRRQVLTVRGRVRSLLRSRAGETGALFAPAASGNRSASPTVVTAGEMQHWGVEGRARYAGGVRLLAEGSQLEARELDVAAGGARVEAAGEVRHLIVRSDSAGPGGAGRGKASPVTIRAARMVYVKADNAAHYSGKTLLTSENVRVESQNLDAVFTPDGRQVERAAAKGQVRVRQLDRDAQGEAADYFLDPGKFVMTGNMAQIADPKRGKSSARRLTFFTSNDKILLENN